MEEKLTLQDNSLPLLTIAEWVKETCLMFGSSVHTAYTVAGVFVEGLENGS